MKQNKREYQTKLRFEYLLYYNVKNMEIKPRSENSPAFL